MIAYKLLRVRKDGSLGPLFIARSMRIPMKVWLAAEEHPTAGYAFRPGWHCTPAPFAPHLSEKGRQWFKVEIDGVTTHVRSQVQGGTWYIAQRLKVLAPVTAEVKAA